MFQLKKNKRLRLFERLMVAYKQDPDYTPENSRACYGFITASRARAKGEGEHDGNRRLANAGGMVDSSRRTRWLSHAERSGG